MGMIEKSILASPRIRRFGRTGRCEGGFPLYWSSSGLEMRVRATALEIEIDCSYSGMKPYLSFEVDGLRAQTFSPLPGAHWYNVFLNLSGEKTHAVRVIKETQPFADPADRLRITRFRTDGRLMPLPARRRKIEFIGDSLTSGEGARGPKSFMEWVPMAFCASDCYPRVAADLLRAEYQVVSQSGWGIVCGWDNDPKHNVPSIYGDVCALTADGRKPYDFSFQPDTVVIALGANDINALGQGAYTDPETGEVSRLTDSPADLARVEDAAYRFVASVHEKNPNAKIVWMFFFPESPLSPVVRAAVERARADAIDARFFAPDAFSRPVRGGTGSRNHPSAVTHRHIARLLAAYIRESGGNV